MNRRRPSVIARLTFVYDQPLRSPISSYESPCAFIISAFASSGFSARSASAERRTRSPAAIWSSTLRPAAGTNASRSSSSPATDSLTRAADRHRLVADDDLQPRDLGRRVDRLDPPDEDLQRALVGVERVVVAERRLARDAQQRPLVPLRRRRPRASAGRRRVRSSKLLPPAGPPCTLLDTSKAEPRSLQAPCSV